ncbi:MAG: hypothetical protein ABH827_00570 [bacterium]
MSIKKIFRKVRYKKQLAIAIMAIASIAILYPQAKQTCYKATQYVYNVLSTPTFSIEYDRIFSQTLKQEISQFIITQINNSFSILPKTICNNLAQKFKAIEHISWHTTAPRTILIAITGTQPAYVVNNSQIVAKNRKLFNFDIFKNYDTDSLKRININKNLYTNELKTEIYTFLNKIPDNFWSDYDITYNAPYNIEIQKKIFLPEALAEHNYPHIITDEKNLLNGEKIKKLAFVQSDMQQERWEHARTKPKDHRLVYDVRFENRVIVKMLKKKNFRRGR